MPIPIQDKWRAAYPQGQSPQLVRSSSTLDTSFKADLLKNATRMDWLGTGRSFICYASGNDPFGTPIEEFAAERLYASSAAARDAA